MATDQQVYDRYRSWHEGAAVWSAEIETVFPEFNFGIDLAILYQVAKSYWNDIDRFKAFHLADASGRADALKKAAFTLYWMARLRPVRVHPNVGYSDPSAVAAAAGRDPSAIANVGYAFAMAWPYLGYRLNPTLQSQLIYLLTYRTLTAEALLSLLTMLDLVRGDARSAFADLPRAS